MAQKASATQAKDLGASKEEEVSVPRSGMKRRSMSCSTEDQQKETGNPYDSPKYFKRDNKRESSEQQLEPLPKIKKAKNFRECEELQIKLNVYDLVWDKNKKGVNNAGFVEIGLGFFHTGLELWGKELSFGHSKRFKSGVFAVKPRRADDLMPHTVFRESIDVGTVSISRYSVDKILNRLSVKYTSDSYNVLRNNCNHFTDELCIALCGKPIPEWINRPAKMGTSALDALNAPFEAINTVMKVFTPSKKSNTIGSEWGVDIAREDPDTTTNGIKTPKKTPHVHEDKMTSAQLAEIGRIPSAARDRGNVEGVVPVMIVDDEWMLAHDI